MKYIFRKIWLILHLEIDKFKPWYFYSQPTKHALYKNQPMWEIHTHNSIYHLAKNGNNEKSPSSISFVLYHLLVNICCSCRVSWRPWTPWPFSCSISSGRGLGCSREFPSLDRHNPYRLPDSCIFFRSLNKYIVLITFWINLKFLWNFLIKRVNVT